VSAAATASGAGAESAVVAEEHAGAAQPDLTLELARVEAERDAAVTALDKQGRRDRRRRKLRRAVVAVFVVLFCVLLPVTYVVTWTHYTVLNTNGFVKTVGPIASDPAVIAAASTALTNEIFTSLNPQQVIASNLPPKASFLAAPVTNAVKGYVQTAVTKVLQSSQFQTLWNQAIRFAHTQVLAVLNGNSSKAVTTTNGQVTLNLVPLLNSALQSMQGFISGVVGKPVTLPTVTASEVPSTACKQISDALNRPLPATCGQIPLFPAKQLDNARRAVRVFNGVTVLLLILTPVVAAVALWLSRRRRRTLLQLSAGGLLGLVVIRRVVIWLESALENKGVPANKPARRSILGYLFHEYFSVSRWILIALLLVFLIALVTGPYPWAVTVRAKLAHYAREGRNVLGAAYGHARDDATVAWVISHLDLLRILGVALAVVLLLALSVSWIGFLIIVVLLAAYQLWLHRLGQRARTLAATPGDAEPSTTVPTDDQPHPPGEAGPAPAV
jgi:hypothetical protein